MAWNPHITAATVIEQDGKFLLVEEESLNDTHLVYNQPAGHIEAYETLVAGAIRETLEETAYLVEITHLLGIYSYTPPSDTDCTYYRFCFIARILSHHPERQLDHGISRACWLSLDELTASKRMRSPLVAQCITDYIAGQSYPLELLNESFLKAIP